MTRERTKQSVPLDTSSRAEFFDYYAQASLSEATLRRYGQIQDTIFRVLGAERAQQVLDVADIGCGAGAQCLLWAERGHRVYGLDVNARLIQLARERAQKKSLKISLAVGTAVAVPWADASMDVCIMPELLEHVEDWRRCLAEAARILRRGGVLFLTTTNRLCPVQQEFNLPLYSWYPAPLKRYCERLARTTRPQLANYATYPAVNWFTFNQLCAALEPMGFRCFDRFQTALVAGGILRKALLRALQVVPLLRAIAQLASPYTQIVAIKNQTAKTEPIAPTACGETVSRNAGGLMRISLFVHKAACPQAAGSK
jgi:2-polyprenyl-6-hydroxyphenyl methylase/3-demethylubiquinone-9 3-methyltransferase